MPAHSGEGDHSVCRTPSSRKSLLRKVGPLTKKVDQHILQAMGGGKEDFLDRLQDIISKLQPSATD